MEPGFYGVVAIQSEVGDGITGSRYCELGGILKVGSDDAFYTVANEYVASRLALMLGLPVPPGTVVQLDDGTLGYAMMKFGVGGDSPPPTDVSSFVANRGHLAAGVVLFDAWILNADRHSGNMAYIPPGKDLVSVFDHGHALMGTMEGKAIERLNALKGEPYLGHGAIIGDLSGTADLESWIGQIGSLRDTAIKEVCRPLLGLGLCSKEERDTLIEVLIHRRKSLRDFVVKERAAFTGIDDDDWGLV